MSLHIKIIALLAAILFLAGSVFGIHSHGVGEGKKLERAEWQAEKEEMQKAAAEQYKKDERQLSNAAEALEKAKNETQIIYRTITQRVDKLVDRPVYRANCIDQEGVEQVNKAFAGID